MQMNRLKFSWLALIFLCTACSEKVEEQNVLAMNEEHANMTPTKQEETPTSPVPGYAPVEIDTSRLQIMGVTTAKVERRPLRKEIRTVGIVEVDETRIANIQTKFSGWIEKLTANFVGMPVKKGQPLFSVYSPELLSTQEEYLLALKDIRHPLKGRFAKDLQQSSYELSQAARRRLELWDISQQDLRQLEQTGKPLKTLTIYSPVEGIITKKNAYIGMNVEPGMNIFTIADLSKIWVIADIYEGDISFVKEGQHADISITSFPDKKFEGMVSFISHLVDTKTRTVKVRFESLNPGHLLKPGMYATVHMHMDLGLIVSVPEEAIIDTGDKKIVFVAKGGGHFEPREVKLGPKAENFFEVLGGLEPGEEVVTSSQFLFDSESRLKAAEGGMPGHGGMKVEKK